MAFKKMTDYVEDKYRNWFRLVNDGDSADVIILYRGQEDVLVDDAHYINSENFNGYVECLGHDCPACKYVGPKGGKILKNTKLFIPLYVLNYSDGRPSGQFVFWDRNFSFQPVLLASVFNRYPNPSEYIFTITRKGAPRDPSTRYSINVQGPNRLVSYDKLLSDNNIHLPEDYSKIVSQFDADKLKSLIYAEDSYSPNRNIVYSPETYKQYNAVPRSNPVPDSIPDIDPVPTPTIELNSVSIPEAAPSTPPAISNTDANVDTSIEVDPNPEF